MLKKIHCNSIYINIKNIFIERNESKLSIQFHTNFKIGISFLIFAFLFFSYTQSSNMNIFSFAQVGSSTTTGSSAFPDSAPDTDRGPTFLDAYWTNYLSTSSTPNNNTVKKEVGPGDGTSTLAVVLVNKGRSDITGITGYLSLLPENFLSIPGKNNGTLQSVASANSIVKAGDTFVLYFDMNVLKQAKVGGYNTPLILRYTKINQIGELQSSTNVPFRLTGKVILDAVSETSQLIPSTPNQLKILIQNKGSAAASGVVARVTGITSTTSSASNTSTLSSSSTSSGSNTTNTGSSTGQSSPSSSNPAVNIGPTTFDIGTIQPNGTAAVINPLIYPSTSAGETVQNMNLQITYGDAYGNQQVSNIPIGLVILPTPPQSVLNATTNNGNALVITSGKIQDLNLTLSNSDTKPITNVVASLTPQSSTIQILGDSRWTFPYLPPQSKMNLDTKVFASSSIVGSPALFTLTVDYISAGQSKTDVLNIGSYISGDIRLRIYDVAINFLGGKPNLVGNLLNEGNTVGLFTTIEVAKSPSGNSIFSAPPPQQYLGDLSVDSPLPFSIPINIDNRTLSGLNGAHPIIFKVAYSDDLKNVHQLLINSSVEFKSKPVRSSNSGNDNTLFGFIPGSLLNNMMFWFVIVIIVVIIVITVLLRRKRKSKSGIIDLQNKNDMESFLADISPTTTSLNSSDNLENDKLQKELRETKISEKQKGKELKK
ncbi:MAG: COG1361 S-layer family protein [Candidatus Nitrosocosmicus sp.]